MVRRLIAFEAAAHINHQKLTVSLTTFAGEIGGEIENWESELVEGIEHYGFAYSADSTSELAKR